jgi:hypothetical protein
MSPSLDLGATVAPALPEGAAAADPEAALLVEAALAALAPLETAEETDATPDEIAETTDETTSDTGHKSENTSRGNFAGCTSGTTNGGATSESG